MRNLLPLLAASCLFASVKCPAAEADWGYAHIFYVKKAIAGNWSAITGSQLTWRDDMSDFYFVYADAGIGYKLNANWSVDTRYRQGWWNIREEWEIERRPMVNVIWSKTWKDIRLSNQARLEFRFYDWNRKDDLRFRNRTRVEFPWELLPGGIKPYVEEEILVGKNSGQLEMNWLMAGLYAKPTKTVKLKAGYRWLAVNLGDRWENRNQLVTGLAWIF